MNNNSIPRYSQIISSIAEVYLQRYESPQEKQAARISIEPEAIYAGMYLYRYMYLKSYVFGAEGPAIPYRFIFSCSLTR
jgi:hypothetical protein